MYRGVTRYVNESSWLLNADCLFLRDLISSIKKDYFFNNLKEG